MKSSAGGAVVVVRGVVGAVGVGLGVVRVFLGGQGLRKGRPVPQGRGRWKLAR